MLNYYCSHRNTCLQQLDAAVDDDRVPKPFEGGHNAFSVDRKVSHWEKGLSRIF